MISKNNLFFKCTFLLLISLACSNCATLGRSLGLGAGVGAGAGAAIGAIADPGSNGKYRTRNVLIGTAFGGIAGLMTADILHKNGEKDRSQAFALGQKTAPNRPANMPSLKNPKVEAKWVEGRIIGNRYVEGHFEYVILEPARWEEGQ